MPTKKTKRETIPKKKSGAASRVKKSVSAPVKAKAAKKTTRRTVPRSVKVTKKVVSSCPGCGVLCKPGEEFWVNNGPVVNSLEGLQQALKDMTDEQYAHHTKIHGNDFVVWMRDCFGDVTCAERLAKARTRTGAVRAIQH